MKSIQIYVPVFLITALIFSGCHTKFNVTDHSENEMASYVENGWLEISGAYFYIDYTTRHWFEYHGIDLATDRKFLRMAYFRYHHPTSTYFYSPFRGSIFYNYPGYANSFFFRANRGRGGFSGTCHPSYYSSNSYMEWFNCDRLANFIYWQTAFPNYWENSYAFNNYSANTEYDNIYRRGISTSEYENYRSRNGSMSSRLAVGDDINSVKLRERINVPSVDRVSLNDENQTIRDRRGDDYRNRLERNRSIRTGSPLTSWNSWEQRNKNNSGNVNRTSRVGNRTSGTRSTGRSAVRGSSSNRGGDSGTTRTSGSNRSSGDSSSSRGNN